MAKPKGTDIVGWGLAPYSKDITILSEIDINQPKRRKAGEAQTWSKGHTVRQLGLAKREMFSGRYPAHYYLYSHSQVSNGNPGYSPPAFVGMNKADLEWLFAEIAKELFGEEA